MIIKCKMCGGDLEFTPGATYGTCEYCGSTSTIPQAENEAKLNRYNRANHFRRQCEFDKALALYEKLLEQDDTDAEAHWGAVISRFGIEYVEDPATGRHVPTCHRVQVVSILADPDYLAAVEHAPDAASRDLYRQQAAEISEIQKGILAISASEKPYDVFICYKETDEHGQRTRDSQWAQEVYYGLTEQGYKVFFSRITLEDKLGQQYEPYIFAALNSARVMVVIGSRPEYFNAVWVKNEWSRYLALMAKDRKRLLIPCYRGMDPYDLPEELSTLQSQDMGRIGFMQDLLRGIRKVLDVDRQPERPRTAAPQTAPAAAPAADANLIALLKRGEMALADGEMQKADAFFEKALNLDAEAAEAYMGKFLAAKQCPSIEAWAEQTYRELEKGISTQTLSAQTQEQKTHIEQQVRSCALGDYLREGAISALYQFDFNYPSTVASWQKTVTDAEPLLKDRNLVRAQQFATGALKTRYETAIGGLTDRLNAQLAAAKRSEQENIRRIHEGFAALLPEADAKAEQMHADAVARRMQDIEKNYIRSCQRMEKAASQNSLEIYKAAAESFEQLGRYKDSQQRLAFCRQAINQLEQEQKRNEERLERERQEAQRRAQRRARKRKKVLITVVSITVVLVISISLLITKVIIPANQYKKAEALLAAGQYLQASQVFASIADYKDAEMRSQDALKESMNQKYALGEGALATGAFHTVSVKRDGTVVAVGDNDDGQCKVSSWKDIVAVAAGDAHTVGLKRDGTVVAVGHKGYGQCEVSDWKDIVAVAAGIDHTVGLKRDGTVVAVGWNEYDSVK